jgi:CheY-like chemotaxis protein
MSTKILYIEDNEEIIELMRLVLEKAGYYFLSALSGMAGLALAHQERPNLILLDINMPDTNGLVIIKRLKGLPHLAAIPCVAVTAPTIRRSHDYYRNMGFDGYIPKPIDSDRLLGLIRALLHPNPRP